MKIELLSYQDNALDILLLTKNTRHGDSLTLKEVGQWSNSKKEKELDYVLNTIPSSWEFVNYVIKISGVSRAMTHQLVRTRTASFAQQSHRLGMSEEWVTPRSLSKEQEDMFNQAVGNSIKKYSMLVDLGVDGQDARGVVSQAITSGIIMGANLRTLSQMAETRLCVRTQGEYQEVFRAIRSEIVSIHPWASRFLLPYCAAKGICQFPNFHNCPLQSIAADVTDAKRRIGKSWEHVDIAPQPEKPTS